MESAVSDCRALVVQHVAVEGPGRIADALTAAGVAMQTIRVHEGQPVPREPAGASGLIVMGGPMGVYEAHRYPHLADELALIARAVADGVPVLGVCLGSQLLAAALGAEVRPSGRQEIGWLPVTMREVAMRDSLFAGAPDTFAPLHWHGDVFDLPPGAESLASSALTEHQAFRAGDRAWGLLFHLEAGAEQVAAMARTFAGDLMAAGVDGAALAADSHRAAAAVAGIAEVVFGRFAALVRAGAR